MKKNKIVPVILVGGLSTRMNHDKGLLVLKDKTFFEIIVNEIRSLKEFREIIISLGAHNITNYEDLLNDLSCLKNQDTNEKFQVTVQMDVEDGMGPFVSLYNIMEKGRSSNSNYMVFSCDMVNINRKYIRNIIEIFNKNPKSLVVSTGNIFQPMGSIFTVNILKEMEESLQSGNRSFNRFIKNNLEKFNILEFKELDMELDELNKIFLNVNTPKEFQKLKEENNG